MSAAGVRYPPDAAVLGSESVPTQEIGRSTVGTEFIRRSPGPAGPRLADTPRGPATPKSTSGGDLDPTRGAGDVAPIPTRRRRLNLPRLARHEIDGRKALPFVKVSTRIVRDATLSRDARLLYAVLATYADIDNRTCFPSKRTLAQHLDCSTKSVQNWVNELEVNGYLTRAPQERRDGSQSSNLYILADDADVNR